MTNKKHNIEDFKKSISSTLKAISKNKDLHINFGISIDGRWNLARFSLEFQ